MTRFLTRACAAAMAGVALGMCAVTAASASGGGGVPIRHGALGPAGTVTGGALRLTRDDNAIGRITAAATSTRTFAGYETAVTAGSATVAAGSFTVPALSCTTADRATAPGAGVPTNKYRSVSAAFLFTGCVNGNAVYFPGLVLNGKETDYTTTPLSAGDVINVTAKVSTHRTTVQVTDATTGVTKKLLGAGARASAAYFGENGWGSSSGGLLGVPAFGKLSFRNCHIDGKTLASWHPHPFQRVNSHGTVQIATNRFWPGGTAFTNHFMHS